jgi:hypothetical protein
MEFKGTQKTYCYTQINNGSIERVFPLLCPVREKDWLDGWDYKMIVSKSGLIEKDCVFTTSPHGDLITVWHVTQYDKLNYNIEFLRVTPTENVVRINIHLVKINQVQTKVTIDYQYTALNENQNAFIKNELEQSFTESMQWWEKAINHYLKSGVMLKKNE